MPLAPKFIRKRGYTPPTNDFMLLTAEQFKAESNLHSHSITWMLDGSIVGTTDADGKYYYTPEPLEITELREAASELLEERTPYAKACFRLAKALLPFEGIESITPRHHGLLPTKDV